MFDIVGEHIKITRGDEGVIVVSAKNIDESDYIFQIGDVIRLKVCKKNDYSSVVLSKDIIVSEEAATVDFPLNMEDTKIGEIMKKKHVDYWYEIELNPDTHPHTIIGHDDIDGAKIFTLLPEGGDSKNDQG